MNLLTNGDFQTGTFAGWTLIIFPGPPTISTSGRPVGPPPHYAANLDSGGISQTIPVTGSTTYYFSFWKQTSVGDFFFGVTGSPSGGQYAGGQSFSTTSWTRSSFTFTTVPTDTSVTVTLNLDFSNPGTQTLVDDIWLTTSPVCYTGETLIRTIGPISGLIEETRADQINTDHLVLNHQGEAVRVVANIVSGPAERLVTFRKGSLGSGIPGFANAHPVQQFPSGSGIPSQDLRLTSGHKLVIDGREIRARDHPSGLYGRCEPTPVYTIVCPTRQYIYANGQLVVAFGEDEWEEKKGRVSHTVQ